MSGDIAPPGTGGPDPRIEPRGSTVALRDDRKGIISRSVRSIAELPSELPAHALVGGLAVIVRLAEPHRVTTDFDEVTAGRDAAIGLLVDQGAERRGSGVFLPSTGLQLDLLEAELPLEEILATPTDDPLEAFGVEMAAAARFALDTAVETRVVVLSADDASEVEVEVSIPVATAGALVAMKTNAARSSLRAPHKAASDCYDAYRLVRGWGINTIVSDLRAAPASFLDRVADNVEHVFGIDADRTLRLLRQASLPGTDKLDVDQLTSLERLADELRSAP